jgi:hypothetical protein
MGPSIEGSNADVEASDYAAILDGGPSEEDIAEVGKAITSLRKQSNNGTPRAKILRMLEDCGASQTPGDIVEAQTILYRGQAAALMAVDRRWSARYEEDDQLVDRVLAEEARSFVPPVPATAGAAGNPAIIRHPEMERVAVVPEAQVADQTKVRTEPVSILALAERLIEEAKLNEWRIHGQATRAAKPGMAHLSA